MKYQILLYYKYVRLDNPEKTTKWQKELCQRLNLKGRIIVAGEGINGTVEGDIESTEKYIEEMEKTKEFSGISYKKSAGLRGNAFPKLSVKLRPEIVTSQVTTNPAKVTGKYITAEELHKWFEEKREFYIVDMRNDYEYISGYFEGFVPSGMDRFFNLKKVPQRLTHLKNKTVVTVCTGGVRCEKASGFLIENGFDDVYQLKDGIQTYMEKYPNGYFRGKLYVFDKRMLVGFNTNSEIVGKCYACGKKSENYVNCQYDECSFHHIRCEACYDKELGLPFDSRTCKDAYIKQLGERKIKTSDLAFTSANL